ncbi:hypothetical protein M069_5794 [Bacteroides fragilis str. B1 (UDC16-1)]|nr:hypothetical protein M069_5794 [Bacteroides fragilis str. B1 (UDC16-1)]
MTIGSRLRFFEEQVVGKCNTPTLTCYSKKSLDFSPFAQSLNLRFLGGETFD